MLQRMSGTKLIVVETAGDYSSGLHAGNHDLPWRTPHISYPRKSKIFMANPGEDSKPLDALDEC